MRRIPQYKNPLIKLRTPPLDPITIEEYRRQRTAILAYIRPLMASLMISTRNQPKRSYAGQGSTQIAIDGVRDMIAFRQQGLASLRRRLAASN
jgi:hypothetical protein